MKILQKFSRFCKKPMLANSFVKLEFNKREKCIYYEGYDWYRAVAVHKWHVAHLKHCTWAVLIISILILFATVSSLILFLLGWW